MNCWIALGLAPTSISSEAKVWSARGDAPLLPPAPLRPSLACSLASKARLRAVDDGRRVERFLGRAAEHQVFPASAASLHAALQVATQDREQRDGAASGKGLGLDHSLHLVPTALDGDHVRFEVDVADAQRLDLAAP